MNKKNVRQLLTKWKDEIGTEVVPFSTFISVDGVPISWVEMTKYIRLEKATTKEYWTIQEVLNELNSCSGTACYEAEYNFKIDEDGRIYNDISGYIIKGWRK